MDASKPEPNNTASDAPDPEFVRSFQRLVGEVFRLNGQMLAIGDRLSQDLKISAARWQIIATLRREPFTVADISRRLGLRRQSIQETVNRLRGQGLVEFRPNPRHARSSLIALTPAGQEVMDTLRERQIALMKRFTKDLDLSTDKIDNLAEALRDLREHAELNDALDRAYHGKLS